MGGLLQELTGNVSKTCRYYGISRQVYYKWLRRYDEGGLEALRDRSSRPHLSPKATRVEVVGKIIYLLFTESSESPIKPKESAEQTGVSQAM